MALLYMWADDVNLQKCSIDDAPDILGHNAR
jgi:hypothetical protein